MRVSSTPRPFGSITNASGVLDHPPSRAMTTERGARACSSKRKIAFPRHVAPEVCKSLPPERVWGMPGAQCTRSRACSVESTRVSHHEYTGITRHSRTRRFTAYIVLSPGTGLFCPRRSRGNRFPQKLGASVGAPGPHDFAVRIRRIRLLRHQRPPHPVSRP